MKPVEEIKYPIQKETERFEEKFKDSMLSNSYSTGLRIIFIAKGNDALMFVSVAKNGFGWWI